MTTESEARKESGSGGNGGREGDTDQQVAGAFEGKQEQVGGNRGWDLAVNDGSPAGSPDKRIGSMGEIWRERVEGPL